MSSLDGPFIVSELLDAAANNWAALPLRVVELYDKGRIIFRPRTLLIRTARGHTIVMSGEDILSFRGDEPYAVLHLH